MNCLIHKKIFGLVRQMDMLILPSGICLYFPPCFMNAHHNHPLNLSKDSFFSNLRPEWKRKILQHNPCMYVADKDVLNVSVSLVRDALGGTGDILLVALCEQGHTVVPLCCLRCSHAAAAVLFPSSAPHCRTAMADSASESDTDGAGSSSATPMSSSASNSGKPSIVISQFRLEELTNRLASLQQENKVLKIELETFKLKCKALQEENRDLRKASVTIVSNVS